VDPNVVTAYLCPQESNPHFTFFSLSFICFVFVVYLRTLSVSRMCNTEWLMSYKLEITWHEAVLA